MFLKCLNSVCWLNVRWRTVKARGAAIQKARSPRRRRLLVMNRSLLSAERKVTWRSRVVTGCIACLWCIHLYSLCRTKYHCRNRQGIWLSVTYDVSSVITKLFLTAETIRHTRFSLLLVTDRDRQTEKQTDDKNYSLMSLPLGGVVINIDVARYVRRHHDFAV